jgi:hypothetical protein
MLGRQYERRRAEQISTTQRAEGPPASALKPE